jgi:G:T-mismatch repair DNA endonuclease (very short patch repair protein)
MPRKLTLDYIKECIENEGYTLLSNKYYSAHDLLKIKCPNNHYLELSWSKWKKGRRCKYCNGSRLYEEAVYKSFEKEGYRIVSIKGSLSKGEISFICNEGHEGTTVWGRWLRGSRCKVCYNINRRTSFYTIKKEIESEGVKVLTSIDYYLKEGRLKCRCGCGYIYYTTVSKWRRGYRCRDCGYRKLSSMHSHSINYVKNSLFLEGYKLLSDSYTNALTPIKVVCPEGHEVTIKWRDWQEGCRCCVCGINSHRSNGEKQVALFLENIGISLESNNRSLISPLELDIVIPDKKIAIEYCGLYWHSELMGKDKNYHLNKLKMCEEKGYRLITIFEDEWINKRRVVESKLSYLLGVSYCRKVYARNCIVCEITYKESSSFCERNHLQGLDVVNSIRLGLFYKNKLVSVMTFVKPSASKGSKKMNGIFWELSRFCTDTDLIVVGGFSKLLSYFRKNYEWDELFSYVDLRWFTGESYEKIGFNFLHRTKPNYWYSNGTPNRKHRFALRKKKNTDLTEIEINTAKGYYRIWDCGNLKYNMKNNNKKG